jgi:hypothetical protein
MPGTLNRFIAKKIIKKAILGPISVTSIIALRAQHKLTCQYPELSGYPNLGINLILIGQFLSSFELGFNLI